MEDAEAREGEGRESTAVGVTCGSGRQRCRFTLIPVDWVSKDEVAGDLLGASAGGGHEPEK